MPHTNNPLAQKRKANRHDPTKPKFLQKNNLKSKKSTSDDPTATTPSTSRAAQTALISEFHALEKLISATKDPLEKRKHLARQEELGGLQAYQEASIAGGDKKVGGETGKWCVKQLKELKIGVDKGKNKEEAPAFTMVDGKKVWPKVERERLRLLDVGAISGTSYSSFPWIEVVSIDLNPQAPHVLRSDFFDFPIPSTHSEKFDVVALSLVLNFVGSLEKRGEMLQRAHEFLRPGGVMYLVLPLPCLTNSRYMNHDRLRSILTTLLWKPVKQHDSAKLTYWLCEEMDGTSDGKTWKKEEVRGGIRRNNFCVVVNGGGKIEKEEVGEVSFAAEPTEEDDAAEWGGVDADVNLGATADINDDDDGAEWGGVATEENGDVENVAVENGEEEWGGVVENGEDEDEWAGI